MAKNFFDNGCGSMGSMILKGRNKVRKGERKKNPGNKETEMREELIFHLVINQ